MENRNILGLVRNHSMDIGKIRTILYANPDWENPRNGPTPWDISRYIKGDLTHIMSDRIIFPILYHRGRWIKGRVRLRGFRKLPILGENNMVQYRTNRKKNIQNSSNNAMWNCKGFLLMVLLLLIIATINIGYNRRLISWHCTSSSM